MLIYKTSQGSGYNPFYSLLKRANLKPWLFADSRRNRLIAMLSAALFLVVFAMAAPPVILGESELPHLPILMVLWALAMIGMGFKEKLEPGFQIERTQARFNPYALEWMAFFAAGANIILYFRNILPWLEGMAVALFALFLALFWLPLAQLTYFNLKHPRR